MSKPKPYRSQDQEQEVMRVKVLGQLQRLFKESVPEPGCGLSTVTAAASILVTEAGAGRRGSAAAPEHPNSLRGRRLVRSREAVAAPRLGLR
ncbi:hypothetical protein R6Z07M_014998 [Ovis aries]